MLVLSRAYGLALVLALAPGCAEPNGVHCDLNSDCVDGYCRDNVCTRDCVDADKDCPKGYVCSDIGKCEFGGQGASGPGGSGAGGSPTTGPSMGGGSSNGGNSPTTTSTTTSTTTTGTGGNSPGSADLTLCTNDSECGSGMCRQMVRNGLKRCTHSCSANSQCASGFRCETVANESFCAESDIGRACNASGQCNYACLSPLNYCVSECTTGADCPNGYGCMDVGGNTLVCVRAEADCAADTSQCVGPAYCDNSLVVSSCTLPCSSAASCPQRANGLPAWTCDGACRRPGDVYGPLPGGFTPAQWACNAQSQVVNICNDGLHIDFTNFTQPNPPAVNCASPTTTDGLGGDACLDSCRYQGACAFSFGCAAVADLGNQRIGLCMPKGVGEVGVACTSNTQCAFGLCGSNNKCSRDCSKDGACPDGSSCVAQGGNNVEGLAYKECQ